MLSAPVIERPKQSTTGIERAAQNREFLQAVGHSVHELAQLLSRLGAHKVSMMVLSGDGVALPICDAGIYTHPDVAPRSCMAALPIGILSILNMHQSTSKMQ